MDENQNTAYSRQMSVRMNKCLDSVGVNDRIIELRRNCHLQIENNESAIKSVHAVYRESVFIFGSQSEGTTTPGLNSDTDTLLCTRRVLVVQDIEQGLSVPNDVYVFEMIQSPTPGYCFLLDISCCEQRMDFVMNDIRRQCVAHRRKDTLLLKNSLQLTRHWHGEEPQTEGPAIFHKSVFGDPVNLVWAFPCAHWPKGVKETFVSNQSKRKWPSKNLTEKVVGSECFVVAKGSDGGDDCDIEWRISFSCGERLLMFDLNSVQIRCYILLKYVKCTFLDCVPSCKDVVSSYICKTVLFHTVSRTLKSSWVEECLLPNFNDCLRLLQKFVLDENCPHFIMPSNNLLLGKLDPIRREKLSREIERIMMSNGKALFEVVIDNFGKLLKNEMTVSKNHLNIAQRVCFGILHHLGSFWQFSHNCMPKWDINRRLACPNDMNLLRRDLEENISRLIVFSRDVHYTNQMLIDAVKIELCKMSTMLGSCRASIEFEDNADMSHKTFQWLLLGIQCADVGSSHLKLASVLLACEDLECSELVLNDTAKKIIEGHVVCFCPCKRISTSCYLNGDTRELMNYFWCFKSFAHIFRKNFGFCVAFHPCEINCCPKELQFEMFRTAFYGQDPFPNVYIGHKQWIYHAVVTPAPFLYFLQYKLYTSMQVSVKRKAALRKLMEFAIATKKSFQHRETILNLVGQCLENEGYLVLALSAYKLSLVIQPKCNAARILICCNLSRKFNSRRNQLRP